MFQFKIRVRDKRKLNHLVVAVALKTYLVQLRMPFMPDLNIGILVSYQYIMEVLLRRNAEYKKQQQKTGGRASYNRILLQPFLKRCCKLGHFDKLCKSLDGR